MESMLFTTLTAQEEASLSGGNWVKKYEKPKKPAPKPPVKPDDKKPLVKIDIDVKLNVINQQIIQVGKGNVAVQEAAIS
ncbi:MAG: hypothetical protein V7K40_05935 [Nostoc sp.]|uniref:hypothetical protein n=1 Tax=Nostoc sp. TaxID=1180 RepID=UPI002FFC1464